MEFNQANEASVMKAAVYCRKSSDEGDKSNEVKSVVAQERDCRAFAAAKGWTVVEVFADDGVSGASFSRDGRPGFFKLLDAVEAKPAFDVLIVTEQSRIGRDTV